MKKKKKEKQFERRRPAIKYAELDTFIVCHCYIYIATHHVDHTIKVLYLRATKMYEIRKQKFEEASSQWGAYVVKDKHKVQTKKEKRKRRT